MQKPKRLKPGNTIAVVSPSWGGPSVFPHIYEDGLRELEGTFGFRVKEYPTARMRPQDLYARPDARAADINAAFRDEDVDAVLCTIGGDDSIRILNFLDVESILSNPKPIMGYSDSTTVLAYLNACGLVTYYGSSVMAGFSHIAAFPRAVEEYKRVLFSDVPYALEPFTEWADGYMDWADPGNRGKTLPVRKDDVGHRWILRGARTVGPLWGGCMEILSMMNGTAFWPEPAFFEGKVLFLETSEEKPGPRQVGHFLRNLGIQGALEGLAGLLVARAKSYSAEEKADLDEEVLRIASKEFGRRDLNIVTNLDIGHTDPRHILPLGVDLVLDPDGGTLTFSESPFRDPADLIWP